MSVVISVVIIAHDRKDFIIRATDSVIDQSLTRDQFEIIAVKNYSDALIDRALVDKGVILVSESAHPIGSKVAQALVRCKGRIICFLEDDDVFFRDKLSKVIDLFQDDTIVYYHNGYAFIGEADQLLNAKHLSKARKRQIRSETIVVSTPNQSEFKELISVLASFNCSCITIKRDILIRWLTQLSQVELELDQFLFSIACVSGGSLVSDFRVLTGYRIHAGNTSMVKGKTVTSFVRNRLTNSTRAALDFKLLASLSGITSCQPLLHYMRNSMVTMDLVQQIYHPVPDRSELFVYIKKWLQEISFDALAIQEAIILLFAFLSIFSPRGVHVILYFVRSYLLRFG